MALKNQNTKERCNEIISFLSENSTETKEKLKKIDSLLVKYNLNLNKKDIKFIKGHITFNEWVNRLQQFNTNDNLFISQSYKNLINLSYLLKTAKDKQTEIKIKSGDINYTLNCEQIIIDLILFVDTLIEYKQDGYFQYKFNWEFKQPIEHDVFDNLTEPYSNEETLSILKLVDEENIFKVKPISGASYRTKAVIKRLRNSGIFDSNCKTIKTNEACFIYDLLVIYGDIDEDFSANNQDKYQHIKRLMKE